MKTINEIKEVVSSILDDGLNICIYLGLGTSENRIYKRLNINDLTSETILKNYIDGIHQFFETSDLETMALSQMDHRGDMLFSYDMPEQPTEFSHVSNLNSQPEPAFFSFDEHSLSNVRSMVIKIASAEKSLIFFKNFYPISLIKRDQILLYKRDERFDLLDGEIIKVTPGFELMLLDGEFYINGFAKFEKAFSFSEIADRTMKSVAQVILALNIVDDLRGHLSKCTASKKDILRAATSEVLQLAGHVIVNFVQNRQEKLGLKVVNGKIHLSSKESVKRLYKLLNDDYLKSELTANDYETLAKNKMN